MTIERDSLLPAEQAVLDLITSNRALVSIVFDTVQWDEKSGPIINYAAIDEDYIDQIIDPTHNRPSRSAQLVNRHNDHPPLPDIWKKMNMRSLRVHDHHPGQCRVIHHPGKDYTHTAKTATSLLTSDPRFMELFFCDLGVGLLWDIDLCDVKKEKYVFTRDGFTDSCSWLNLETQEDIQRLTTHLQAMPLATIASIRERNEEAVKNKKSIIWNEILAGLPKGLINGLFATLDVPSSRLRAYKLMLHIKEKLQLVDDLPIFIIQPFYSVEQYDSGPDRKVPDRPAVFQVYTQEERLADLAEEKIRLAEEAKTAEILQNQRALAVFTTAKEVDALVGQLLDPKTNRPSRSADFFNRQSVPIPDVTKKMNLATAKIHDHRPGKCRETTHQGMEYTHTAKVDACLVPSDMASMQMPTDENSIALLWDVDNCDVKKEKYVFRHSSQTDDCFWLEVDTPEKVEKVKERLRQNPLCSIADLQAQNRQACEDKKVIERNTVLAGLPKGKVDGIVCFGVSLNAKLTAWKLMRQIKEKLKLDNDIPMYVAGKTYESNEIYYRPYTEIERVNDQVSAPWYDIRNNPTIASASFFGPRNRVRLKKEDEFVLVQAEEIPQDNLPTNERGCALM